MKTNNKQKTLIITVFALLITAIIVIIAVILNGKNKPNEPVPSVTVQENTSTEDEVKSSTETSTTQTATKYPYETVEPTQSKFPLVSTDVYGYAYHSELLSHYYDLANYYYWQFDYEVFDEYPYHKKIGINPIVSFSEVTGDDIPEMMLVTADEFNSTVATIYIYTLKDDKAECIFSEDVDDLSVNASGYILFKNGNNELCLYTETDRGNSLSKRYDQLTYDKNSGTIKVANTLRETEFYSDDESDDPFIYVINGKEVKDYEFNEKKDPIFSGEISSLLYDSLINYTDDSWVKSSTKEALLYADATNMLFVNSQASDNELPFYSAVVFEFASGVGGWGTSLSLHSDGTFTADFSDSDMGDCGEGYEYGTVYGGSAFGCFTKITKIDDYTYSLYLDDYTDTEDGDPYIEDEIRFVPSSTYGLEKGEWLLYLPGRETTDFTEEMLFWGYAHYSDMSTEIKLPGFMLYNVSTEYSFFSY